MSSMSDFVIRNGILQRYVGSGGDVVIPDGISEIGESAFYGANLHSIVIPSGVTKIDKFAFCGGNLDLEKVVLPDTLDMIGANAFEFCRGLKELTMPAREIEIEEYAFSDCPSLADEEGYVIVGGVLFGYFASATALDIPDGVRRIGWCAFRNNRYIKEIKLPEGCVCIGVDAFQNCCDLQKILFPNSLRVIGQSAFNNCSNLIEINLPEGLERVERYAFSGCENLSCVKMSGSLQEVGEDPFYGRNMTLTVDLWTSVISKAVKNSSLNKIYTRDFKAVPAKYRPLAAIGYAETHSGKNGEEQEKSYIEYLRKNVSKLATYAIAHPQLLGFLCEQKVIKENDMDSFMEEAEKCGDTEEKALLLNYQNLLNSEKLKKARAKREEDKDNYFDEKTKRMAAHTLPDGIDGLTFVVSGALSAFPRVWKSQKEVRAYLEYYGAKLGSSVTKDTDYLVTDNVETITDKLRKAKELGIQIITEAEFNDMVGRQFKDSPHITIPKWLKTISEDAFINCKSLKSVTIPDGMKRIDDYAFCGCESLNSVVIPEGVTRIGEFAFKYCSNLTYVKLPASLMSIGLGAFWTNWTNSRLTICAPAGSCAEQYAKENRIPFIAE